jgi:putative redox protein
MTAEVKRATLVWEEDLIFRGGAADGSPQTVIDGDNTAGPGPMLTLLLAAAACSGSDVVVILRKMRVALRAFRIEASGVRREQDPKRFTALHLEYHLAGEGLDEGRARRAIDLSLEKYCSVMASLAPDTRITYGLTLA